MSFIARKFTKAKWERRTGLEESEISADSVTSDLRTTDNTLSFWECGESSDDELLKPLIAMSAAGDRIDKIDLVWLKHEELKAINIQTCKSDGNTPVKSLVKLHIDACSLDILRLGKVAEIITNAINENRWRRYTVKDVKIILASSVKQGHVSLSELPDKICNDVKKILEKED